jgi:hypothetical protein
VPPVLLDTGDPRVEIEFHMRRLSSDTDLDAERVQIELLRQAGPARRAQMALSLSEQVIGLARRAVRRSMPGAAEDEISLQFVARLYGTELAAELRQHLLARRL